MSVEYKYYRVSLPIADDLNSDAALEKVFQSESFNLGKDWHSVHFALTGSLEDDFKLLSKTFHGEEILFVAGVDFSCICLALAKELLAEFSNFDFEVAEHRLRQDHGDEKLYSFDYGNPDDAIEEVLSQLQLLMNFFKDAVDNEQIVLIETV
jgi:hypothetical protein